jgi:protoporphyrinogen/coproporphyrinogen III oxidase
VARASGARLRLGLPVRQIQATGAGFRVVMGPVPAPTVLDADAVIVAVPAQKAAGMLGELTAWAAHELSGIDYASTALVTLAYPESERWPAGSGVLVAPTENRAVKALTFSSQKWAHLAGGTAIVRASVARHGEERVLQRPDDELADIVTADVAALTGVATRPVEVRVTRWGGALPQYAVGHLDRVRRIRAEVDRVPGLAVCGAAYDGVGVPACIRTGRQAASRVLAHLAVERQSEHG